MPKAQIVGLNTLKLQSTINTVIRPHKKRVFTEDEWNFLNRQTTEDLKWRISQGDLIINLLKRPEMLNMTPAQAAMISSNLKFQQEAIREIIRSRQNGGR